MKVKLASGNRITIPKPFIQEHNLIEGQYLDLQMIEGKLVLTFLNTDSQPQIDKSKATKQTNKATKQIKLVSNLEEGQSLSKKYYSDCKLVIRTKNSYLKTFCEKCQGLVERDNKTENYICSYNLHLNKPKDVPIQQPVKEIKNTTILKHKEQTAQEIRQNVNKLSRIINTKIERIKQSEQNLDKPIQLSTVIKQDTPIIPIRSRGVNKCVSCGEFHKNGYNIEDSFYCRSCTIKEFNKFLKIYRQERKNK